MRNEERRCCENCGNVKCSNRIVAIWWKECLESNFTRHWTPKENKYEISVNPES